MTKGKIHLAGTVLSAFLMVSLLPAQTTRQMRSVSKSGTVAMKIANLKVEDVTWSPASFSDGATVSLSYRVHNNGNAPANRFSCSFEIAGYLSKSQVIAQLAAGQSRVITHIFKARCGSQDWSIFLDSRQRVAESNETDNTWRRNLIIPCPGKPYLTAHSVHFSHPFNLNDNVHFTFIIENRGHCWAPATVAHFMVDGRVKKSFKVPALHRSDKVNLSADWKATCSGTVIRIVTDALNRVDENNESDQKNWEKTMRCAGGDPRHKPDLMIDKVEITPAKLFNMENMRVRVTVRNISHDCQTGKSAPCVLYWHMRGLEQPMHSKLERIDLQPIPSACQGINSNFRVVEREYTTGLHAQNYRFTLEVDKYGQVDEGDETNNSKILNFTVQPRRQPDLVISDIHSPDPTRYVGQKITVHATVKNIGTLRSTPCRMKMLCYRDKLRDTQVQALDPGQEVRKSFFFRWATQGSKKCEVWIDVDRVVIESDEGNNYRVYNSIRVK